MSARTLAYKLMVLTPVIFFAGLGVHARTYSDPFQPAEQTPLQQAAITAYAEVMRATEPVLRTRGMDESPDAVRSVAKLWIAGANSGHLKPLEPVSVDDSTAEGVKGQIFGAKSILVGRLLATAKDELAAREWDQAAADSLLAMQLSQILKYSSFESVHSCAGEQKRALEVVAEALPHLSVAYAEDAKSTLQSIASKQTPLNVVASLARRLLVEDMIRAGDEPMAIQAGKEFMTARRAIEDNPDLDTFRRVYRRTVLASSDGTAPSLLSVARLAYSSQSEFCTTLQSLLQTAAEPTRV